MPRNLDAAARERAVVDATWRLLAREGMQALTVRRVAAEAGLAPSSLRYTFPSQADILRKGVAALSERLKQRLSELPETLTGRDWARAAILELLPLDEQRRLEVRVFLAFGVAAVTNPALQPLWGEVDLTIREVCIRAGAAIGKATEAEVDLLHAAIDGLALHLLVRHGSDDWAYDALDHYLNSEAGASAQPSAS